MTEIPSKVANTFERLKREETGYIELKIIKGKYYVYRSTSEWDKDRKKPRKITEYVGSITSDGVFLSKRVKAAIQETDREIYEHGNCMLAYHFVRDIEEILKQLTPYYRELIAVSIIKAIDSKPIRLFSSRWEKFYQLLYHG